MKTHPVTINCEGFLSDLEARGFRLRLAYELWLEEHFRSGALNQADRAPPNSTVQVSAGGIDAPLLGPDEWLWVGRANKHVVNLYPAFRTAMEAEKRKDSSFPQSASAWSGTKADVPQTYRRIASELELPPPSQRGKTLRYSLNTASGTLRLDLDIGGNPLLDGRLPIYYHFKPKEQRAVFLSDLRWAHSALREYFTFVDGGVGEDGAHWVKLDELSAVHGIRTSLVALQALADNLT